MRTPATAESFLRFPTSTFLATPGSVRVLRELLRSEEGPLAVSTLAERTLLTPQTVRNALAALQRGGIAEGLGEGRSRLYRADVGHPLYLPLGSLFQAEEDRFATVMHALATAADSLTPAPLGVWIYGSVARRQDLPDGDLEAALVAADDDVETTVDRFRDILGPIQNVQRVWISVVGLSRADVRRLAAGDRWWAGATEPHIPVFGRTPVELAAELHRPGGRSRQPFGR
jgi:DNA-binding transcriptional ArsR family regulator